jgi:hypothetical protein
MLPNTILSKQFYLEWDLKYKDIFIRHENGWSLMGMTSIKYIHQLQNLYFSITGEELVMNN